MRMKGLGDYDVLIIGSGVSGASVARRLSAYYAGCRPRGQRSATCPSVPQRRNSGIIHGGFHHNAQHLKARLEITGNAMFDQLHQELGFPFRRCGILVVATHSGRDEGDRPAVRAGRGERRQSGIEMCSRDRMLELEPKLSPDVLGGLHAPSGGIIEPYRFVFCLVESARKNGVQLFTDFQGGPRRAGRGAWTVSAEDGRTLRARYVINAAGLFADEISRAFHAEALAITPRKGEYFLLDRLHPCLPVAGSFPGSHAQFQGSARDPDRGGDGAGWSDGDEHRGQDGPVHNSGRAGEDIRLREEARPYDLAVGRHHLVRGPATRSAGGRFPHRFLPDRPAVHPGCGHPVSGAHRIAGRR